MWTSQAVNHPVIGGKYCDDNFRIYSDFMVLKSFKKAFKLYRKLFIFTKTKSRAQLEIDTAAI